MRDASPMRGTLSEINLIFLVLWCAVLAMAAHGVDVHRRSLLEYRAAARDPRCRDASRPVFLEWARDEWYRMMLKALLALTAFGWLVFWWAFAEDLDSAFHDWTFALFLRAMTVVGVGGSVLLLSAWTEEVARARKAKHPEEYTG
jgi:hypothetical protein